MKELDLHRKYIKKILTASEKRVYKTLLKKNAEFRADSRDYKAMNKLLNKKLKRITVPDDVREGVFKLTGIKPVRRRFKWKYLSFLLILPLALFLFSEAYFDSNYQNDSILLTNEVNDQDNVDKNIYENEVAKDQNDFTISNEENLADKKTQKYQINKNNVHAKEMTNDAYNLNRDNHRIVAENLTLKGIEKSGIQSYHKTIDVVNKSLTKINDDNITPELTTTKKYNFSIELANTTGWYSSKPLIESNSISQIENFEYAFLFSFNSRYRVGLLYKNELLYTNYTITNDVNTFRYYKYVELNSYGLVAEYTTFTIIPKLTSFIRLGVSFSKNAMISKEMFGMKYALYEDVYFKLGLETNQYYYKALDEIKIKGKYNLIFGVGLSF